MYTDGGGDRAAKEKREWGEGEQKEDVASLNPPSLQEPAVATVSDMKNYTGSEFSQNFFQEQTDAGLKRAGFCPINTDGTSDTSFRSLCGVLLRYKQLVANPNQKTNTATPNRLKAGTVLSYRLRPNNGTIDEEFIEVMLLVGTTMHRSICFVTM